MYKSSGLLLSHKKNEILSFVRTQTDLESIMLTRIRQRQIPYDFTCMWNLKTKPNKTKQTELQIQRTNRYLPEKKELGEVEKWVKEINRYKLQTSSFKINGSLI